MKRTIAFVLLGSLALLPAAALAKSEPMVGGQAMYPRDEKGAVASISTYDVYQATGVIHVIDRVVLPN